MKSRQYKLYPGVSLDRRESLYMSMLCGFSEEVMLGRRDPCDAELLSQVAKEYGIPRARQQAGMVALDHFAVILRRVPNIRPDLVAHYALAVPVHRIEARLLLVSATGHWFASVSRRSDWGTPASDDIRPAKLILKDEDRPFPLARPYEYAYMPQCYDLSIWRELGTRRRCKLQWAE